MKIILAITGATGAVYGIRLLEWFHQAGIETHLVVSEWGLKTISYETVYTEQQLQSLSTCYYQPQDMFAPIASGSFRHDGMVIAPCSMKTMAAISHGYADNLITRAADVVLKEHGRLILLPRETPLSSIHLENMLNLSRTGAVIVPPIPSFYSHPQSIDDLVNHTVARTMDQLGIESTLIKRWGTI